MKDVKDIAIVIQARTNSTRVPKKMIKDFGGTTLLDIALEKVTTSEIFSRNSVWLCVHEFELAKIGAKYGINIFHRTEASANSEGEEITELYEWWNKIPFKYVVMINACTPFLKLETIEKFVQFYANLDDDDVGAFGVIPKKNYFWNEQSKPIVKLDPRFKVMNTKFVDTTYEGAHCLYASKLSRIGEEKVWMGDFNVPGDIKFFPVEEEETFDIDYPWQFDRGVKIYGK